MKSLCLCASVLITTVLLATSLFAGHYETVNKLFLIDKYHQEMKLADARRDSSEMMLRTNKLIDYCKSISFTPEEIESVRQKTKIDPEQYRKDYIKWLTLRREALMAITQHYVNTMEGRAKAEDDAKVKAKVKLWTESEKSFNAKYRR